MKGKHVRIKQDRAGRWRYTVFAGNHEKVATPGQGYATRSGARRAAKREFPTVPIVSATALPRD